MNALFLVSSPWLVMVRLGVQVIRIDLRLVDRIELDSAEAEHREAGAFSEPGAVLLSCGDLTARLVIPEGAEAAAQLVREATPLTDGLARWAPIGADAKPPANAAALPGVFRIASSTADASVSENDPLAGKDYEFTAPRVTIGRLADNDIVIEHSSVSARHAVLERDPATARYSIADLQSANGVCINGQTCERALLHEGDTVDLGSVRMHFFAQFDLQELAPPHVARFVFVGGDAVQVVGGSVTIGETAFSVEAIREAALEGSNLTIAGGGLLQAALALLVVAAAGREVPTSFGDFWSARTGAGDGPPIVWLHDAQGLWDRLEVAAELTDSVCVSYRYDQRGCRRTSARGANTVAQNVADLENLRAHWGLERIVVAGHGVGAIRAVHYALAYPQRVAGLVLVGAVGLVAGSDEAFREEVTRRLGPGDTRMDAAFQRLGTDPSLENERALLELLYEADAIEPSVVREQFVGNPRDNMEAWLDLANDNDRVLAAKGFDERLRSLRIPTLVVHGERDARPAWAARALVEKLSRAKLLLAPNGGHFPWLDAPAILRAELHGFLGGLPSSESSVTERDAQR